MKILIISQYYPPETGACSNRISGFARFFSAKGDEVTVITGFPNYPYRRIYPGYKRHWCLKDQDGNIQLFRTWLSTFFPRKPIHRFFNYVIFFFSSFYAALFKAPKTDVVIATSGPILVGFCGALASFVRRMPFVLDIRDVWPERIIAAGEFKNPFAIRILEWIEAFLYHKAKLIICVTESMRHRLIEKGIPKEKLVIVENGTDIDPFERKVFNHFKLSDHGIPSTSFIVVYAGTFGLLQDHELILKSADRLKEYPDIQFLLIGEGVKRSYLEEKIKQFKNIHLLANQEKENLEKILSQSHVGINTNTAVGHNQMALPVKIFEYMALGLPIVLANEGESKKLVEFYQVGYCVEPGNVQGFSNAILSLYQNPELRKKMGENGQNLVKERFMTKHLAQQLESHLNHVLK